MHPSDKLGCGIMIAGPLFIGVMYLLFRLVGDSKVLVFLTIAGMLVLMGFIARFFAKLKDDH